MYHVVTSKQELYGVKKWAYFNAYLGYWSLVSLFVVGLYDMQTKKSSISIFSPFKLLACPIFKFQNLKKEDFLNIFYTFWMYILKYHGAYEKQVACSETLKKKYYYCNTGVLCVYNYCFFSLQIWWENDK